MSGETEAHVELQRLVDHAEGIRATAVTVDAAQLGAVLDERDRLKRLFLASADILDEAHADANAEIGKLRARVNVLEHGCEQLDDMARGHAAAQVEAETEARAYRRLVLVQESDVEGITLERALEVAKARGWEVHGPGWPSWLEVSYGSSALSVAKRFGVADGVTSIANAVAHRATDDACPLDIVEEMRGEGE